MSDSSVTITMPAGEAAELRAYLTRRARNVSFPTLMAALEGQGLDPVKCRFCLLRFTNVGDYTRHLHMSHHATRDEALADAETDFTENGYSPDMNTVSDGSFFS